MKNHTKQAVRVVERGGFVRKLYNRVLLEATNVGVYEKSYKTVRLLQ